MVNGGFVGYNTIATLRELPSFEVDSFVLLYDKRKRRIGPGRSSDIRARLLDTSCGGFFLTQYTILVHNETTFTFIFIKYIKILRVSRYLRVNCGS